MTPSEAYDLSPQRIFMAVVNSVVYRLRLPKLSESSEPCQCKGCSRSLKTKFLHCLVIKISLNRCNSLKSSSPCLENIQKPHELGDLNPGAIRTVVLDQTVPVSACLEFVRLLQKNSSFSSQGLDLWAYLNLICRLLKAEDFNGARELIQSLSVDSSLTCPISDMGTLLGECGGSNDVIGQFYDLLMRVCANDARLDDALQVFDEMTARGFVAEEKTCIACLVALGKFKKVDDLLSFFEKMVDSGVKVTVFTLSVLVDSLCKNGDIQMARQMVSEAGGWGIEMTADVYNPLIEFYMKAQDFGGLGEVLKLMEGINVARNESTYIILLDGYKTNGKMEELVKVYDDLCKGGAEVDVYLYTALISWHCKNEDVKHACRLFVEMTLKNISPTIHTYGALINGLCQSGQLDAAEMLLKEMQGKGLELDKMICNTLIDGYCKLELIDKAITLKNFMEQKGIKPNAFVYKSLAMGLCTLKRNEDLKRNLTTLLENGFTLNIRNCNALIDLNCKEGNLDEASSLVQEMEETGLICNVVAYNSIIEGYCKNGKMDEAYAVKAKMGENGVMPDVCTYTSLIHGECLCGKLDDALNMLNEMSQRGLVPNVATYAVMISIWCKEGRSAEAFELYEHMIDACFTPESKAYVSLVRSLHSGIMLVSDKENGGL